MLVTNRFKLYSRVHTQLELYAIIDGEKGYIPYSQDCRDHERIQSAGYPEIDKMDDSRTNKVGFDVLEQTRMEVAYDIPTAW